MQCNVVYVMYVMYVCIHIYIYTYIHIYTQKERLLSTGSTTVNYRVMLLYLHRWTSVERNALETRELEILLKAPPPFSHEWYRISWSVLCTCNCHSNCVDVTNVQCS